MENKLNLISGDFNINLLNVEVSNQCQEFVDSIYNHSCIPLITKPTRVTSTTATLLDNIFCNILPHPSSGILVTDISDHFPIFTFFPLTQNLNHRKSGFVRQFSEENLNRFKSELKTAD